MSLTEFRNHCRLLKEANSLLNHGVVKTVNVAALHAKLLSVNKNCGELLIARGIKGMIKVSK